MNQTDMAALALLIISSLSVVRASGGEVTWETIRRAIGDTICFSAADKAPPKLAFADPDSCTIKAPTPLADAVRRSLVDTRALRATIPGVFSSLPPEVEKAIQEGNVSRMPLDVIRTTTIKRPEFLNTLMPTLIKHLSDTGITCPDCPRPDAPSHDVPAWETFFPYVAAFVAIDPIEETSAPGKKPVYGFHVCSGAVDDSGIQAKDPVLLHAHRPSLSEPNGRRGDAAVVADGTDDMVGGEFHEDRCDANRDVRRRTRAPRAVRS